MRAALLTCTLAATLAVTSTVAAQSSAIVEVADAEAELAALRVDYGSRHPRVVAAVARVDAARALLTRSPDPIDTYEVCLLLGQRIDTTRTELAAQRTGHGPRHPIVRRLQARLRALEQAAAPFLPCPC